MSMEVERSRDEESENGLRMRRGVGSGNGDGDKGEGEEGLTIERIFESKEVPSWGSQLTVRSVVVSIVLGFLFTFIVMKLNITTGVIPSLNVAAGLLGFFMVKVWTTVLSNCGFVTAPFTRQENTVIQTAVVASSGIAFSSGYGSYVMGMIDKVAAQAENGNTPANVKKLSLLWMFAFLASVSFVGLFSIMPLRKIMILKKKLTYPSGTATAYLINSFHTPAGAKLAKKQVAVLFKWFGASFMWAGFQWFYTAADGCGFSSFPTFGLEAFSNKFYFDFSATYVGVGMICPHLINLSLLLGSVISWGIMWPLIEKKKGIWYDEHLSHSSLKGLQGYKVFIAIATILGDGAYNFIVVLVTTIYAMIKSASANKGNQEVSTDMPVDGDAEYSNTATSYDDLRRTHFFLKDQIPTWIAVSGYILLAAIAVIVVPLIFHQLKWYHVILIYIVAPALAFCNSYGCGLTDWSLASSYGKLAIFIFGSWVGLDNGGIIAGLAACGVMMSIVSTASDLMQDFKTGYLTLASPRSMFFSQIIGTATGCIISPLVFWFFFYKAYPTIGEQDGSYPAPYALLYRGIALIGTEGFDSLPKNCAKLSLCFFLLAVALNAIRDILKHYNIAAHKYVPSAMAMAIPFYLGGYFTIDMCVGSLIRFLLEMKNKAKADAFVPAMASGMICGDSLWGMPAAILSLFHVQPPICMKFLSRSVNAKVDGMLAS